MGSCRNSGRRPPARARRARRPSPPTARAPRWPARPSAGGAGAARGALVAGLRLRASLVPLGAYGLWRGVAEGLGSRARAPLVAFRAPLARLVNGLVFDAVPQPLLVLALVVAAFAVAPRVS